MSIKIIEGDYQLASARFGLAVARFNSFIVDRLLEGALDAAAKAWGDGTRHHRGKSPGRL